MILIYILLAIIAVGVLLASSAGKKLLIWLGGFLIGGAILFLIGILAISFLSSKTAKEMVPAFLLALPFIICAIGASVYSNNKESIKKIWVDKWRSEPKLAMVFIAVSFPSLLLYIIYALIKHAI